MAGRPAKLRVEIDADASGVAKGTKEAEGRFGKLGGSLGKLGGPAAVAGAALLGVGAAAVGMAAMTVKSASDLEQAMGAVGTVFGKSARQVEGYSKTAALRLGLASAEYGKLAASVGTSLTSMGKSEAEAANLTDQLITRAADLAATFGGTTSEAVQALGSAFRGEFDSIERLGLNIKASDISARLAAKGQSKLTGEALKAAQGQATLDLIMQKSKKSTGAFGREANTVAGQQARLTAQWENAKATVGARLTPVLLRLADYVQQRVIPAVSRMWAFFRDKVVPVIRDYFAPQVAALQRHIAAMSEKVNANRGSFEKLRPVIEKLGAFIQRYAPIMGQAMGRALDKISSATGFMIDRLANLIDFVERVIGAFQRMRDRVGAAVQGVRDAANSVGDLVGKLPGFSLEITPMVPGALAGPTGGLGPGLGMLATAASADPLAYSLGGGAGRHSFPAGAGRTINMPITVNGALDPVAVARQLEGVLRDATIRLGRAPAFGW